MSDDACGAEKTDGDECQLPPGWGTDHVGEGRCKLHGGASTGAPENNDNAATHELYSQTNTYYQRRSDADQALIDGIFEDYHERYVELHGEPPRGDEAMLFKIAVNIHKQLIADNWLEEKPAALDSGHPLVDRSEKRTAQGEEYYEYVVTAVDKAEHRLATRTRQWLKDMDLLGTDDDGTTVNVNVQEEILAGLKAAHGDDT